MSSVSPLLVVLILCSSVRASILEVKTHLYGVATLPCKHPFVSGSESLYVTWEKRDNLDVESSAVRVAHSFRGGEDHSEDQYPEYRGRTVLSGALSRGYLDLTLNNVTFSDEGIYYCRAANAKDRGDIPVKLTLDRLNAVDPSVYRTTVNGYNRLMCFTTGVFRKPQIEWVELQNSNFNDLSEYGSLNVIEKGDGTQEVRSLLDYDVRENVHYFCHVKEGRLKRTARAVISDGQNPVIIKTDL